MGEAKRRRSSTPTLVEKSRRLIRRAWLLYPAWYRAVVSVEFKAILAFLLIGGAAILLTSLWFRP